MKLPSHTIPILAALALAGYGTASMPALDGDVPPEWGETAAGEWPGEQWWEAFGSDELSAIMQLVEERNLDLQNAERSFRQAHLALIDADAQRVFDAGWSEEALYHAISVCAIFNFMNRIVEGCGVESNPAIRDVQRERHEAMRDEPRPYTLFARTIGAFD